MRRLLFATLLAVVVSSNVGCFLPIYSAEPERRTRQLIDTSENLRLLLDEWELSLLPFLPSHINFNFWLSRSDHDIGGPWALWPMGHLGPYGP